MKNKFYLLFMLALLPSLMFAQNYTFTAVANCPEPIADPATINIGDSIYIVSGCIGNAANAPKNLTQHVWLYNTDNNTWTRMNDFPGLAVYGTSSFVINGLGYMVNGWDSTETGAGPANLWQYNPATDTWTNKAPFPGPTRYTCASFALNNKGYIGLGFKPLYNDMWQYDPATDSWTQMANFPGVPRQAPVYFTVGNYAYVGLGAVGDNMGGFYLQSDFYKFDPIANTWTTLGVFPGDPISTNFSFVLNGEAYVACGGNENALDYHYNSESKNVWKYDAPTDTWTLWGQFPDTALNGGAAGTGNGAGFFGLGVTNSYTYPISSDFYRFGPGTAPYSCNAGIVTLPVNNATDNFEAQGNFSPTAVLSWSFGDGGSAWGTSVTHIYSTAGTYQVILNVTDTANGGCSAADTISATVTGISNCSVSLTSTNINADYTLIANSTGVAPYTFLWSTPNGYSFSTFPAPLVYVPTGDTANFCVLITDSTGCQAHACEQIIGALDTTITCQTYLYVYPSTTVVGLYYGYVYHTGAAPVMYVWNFGDGTIDSSATDSLPNHQYASNGFYDLCLTIIDSNNCSSSFCDSSFYAYKVGGGPMNDFQVVSTPPYAATGINNINGSLQLSVYPNPATDQLAVVVNNKIDYLEVYNALGQKVKEQEAPVNNTIDIATLASGVYFMNVHVGSASGRVKFVKTN